MEEATLDEPTPQTTDSWKLNRQRTIEAVLDAPSRRVSRIHSQDSFKQDTGRRSFKHQPTAPRETNLERDSRRLSLGYNESIQDAPMEESEDPQPPRPTDTGEETEPRHISRV